MRFQNSGGQRRGLKTEGGPPAPDDGVAFGLGIDEGDQMACRRLLALALLLSAALVGGCAPVAPTPTLPESTAPPPDLPAADDVVAALADGLEKQDVGRIATADPTAAQAELKAVFAGMDGLAPTVTVKQIVYDGADDSAVATLEQAYEIGTAGWTFTTQARLAYRDPAWLIEWTPQIIHPLLTSDSRLRHQRKTSKRAPINDSEGLALVEERSVYQLGLDKAQVTQAEWGTAAADLANLVGVDAAQFTAKVMAGGPKQFVIAKTVRQEEIPPTLGSIPGAQVVEAKAMIAPSATFAASLLGIVGTPTAEQVTDSKGQVWASDTVGLSGLQARYDAQLRGAPEVNVDLVGRRTEQDPKAADEFKEQNLFHQDASVGTPLDLALDRALQTRAEEVLAGQEGLAALVVIRPADGALLAAANSPAAGVFPQATYGKFAPGSTFKVVSSLAMLRAGFTPTSPVKCPSSLNVSGHVFGNYSDYPSNMLGTITLTQALANSCNTAFAAAASSITPERLHAAGGSLGVGTDYDAGFTSNFGTVEPNNSPIDRAASMIGQGQITMSPMAMAAVAASVASGRTTIPWLVKGKQATSTAAPLTDQEAKDLQQMMRSVVTSGSGRVLAGLMDGAKTGTAEFGKAGNYQTHAWMIAWNADYAVAAFVEVGKSGSGTAAPLIRALFS